MHAWLSAAEMLLDEGSALNVILDISNPATEGPREVAARQIIDRLYRREKSQPTHTVAETIFPGWDYVHYGLTGMFEHYAKQYSVFKRGDSSWGRYAHRLIHRTGRGGEVVNPLARIIRRLKWARSSEGTAYRSSYEMGLDLEDYELPIHDDILDGKRWRGGPCLSHLSFKLIDDTLHLTALYRSHDYRYRVPGNLLGLARLQACVSHECGAKIGSLVIHSTYAYFDEARGRQGMAQLVRAVGSLYSESN